MTNGDVLIKRLDDISCFLAVCECLLFWPGYIDQGVLPPSSFVAIVNVIGFLFLR